MTSWSHMHRWGVDSARDDVMCIDFGGHHPADLSTPGIVTLLQ